MMRAKTSIRLAWTVFVIAIGQASLTNAGMIADSINPAASPFDGHYDSATDVGWFYTPSSSYSLDGILTKFSPSFIDGRTVTVEILDGATYTNGLPMRSASFVPVGGVFEGGTFAPLALTAGHQYFVGLLNVSDFSFNVTQDNGAQSLGSIQVDLDHSGKFNAFGDPPGSFTSQPILEFTTATATVPEPSTILSAGFAGLMGLGYTLRRRRTKLAV